MPITVEKAWDYFSNPGNLKKITPPAMNFAVTSTLPRKMFAGLIITYKVSPFKGIRVRWLTEIIHVDEPHSFIDEQRFGPYRFWHHRHVFKEIPGGCEMTDEISYALRFDPISRPVNALLVDPKLKFIFDYRAEVLSQMFGTCPAGSL